MHVPTTLLITHLLITTIWPAESAAGRIIRVNEAKQYDLVLVHGLANRHRWSEAFLETCLEIWGTDRVFVVYTNEDPSNVRRNFRNGTVIFSGGAGRDAGTESIARQTQYLFDHIDDLLKARGLRKPFSIIAHSMGGLVARRYVYENPGTVAGLVTLGTPHHGSPLADALAWGGFVIHATDAVRNLQTDTLRTFNLDYPAGGLPLAVNKTMHTIRGGRDDQELLGPDLEIQLAGWTLTFLGFKANDGLVPDDSARIEGAENIIDFPEFNHNDLVRRPEVVRAAATVLP